MASEFGVSFWSTPRPRWARPDDMLWANLPTVRDWVAHAATAHHNNPDEFYRLYTMMELACPERDWNWLRTAHARMRKGLLPRKYESSRTRPSGDLLRLGIRLMSDNDRESLPKPIFQSVRYRDGLMIALFAARPLRLTNFAALHVGKSLVRSGDGWQFLFRAHETKSHRPLHLTIPPELAPFLERYLERHRPLLLDCLNRRERKRVDLVGAIDARENGPWQATVTLHRSVFVEDLASALSW